MLPRTAMRMGWDDVPRTVIGGYCAVHFPILIKPAMLAQVSKSRTLQVEAGGSEFQSHPWQSRLHETLVWDGVRWCACIVQAGEQPSLPGALSEA